MSNLSKKDAIRIITSCAKDYANNLAGKNLLFLFLSAANHISGIETKFSKSNFMHLTGLKTIYLSPIDFYERCVNGKIKEEDFEFAHDGTTELKLEVLPILIKNNLSAKMIGNYCSTSPKLYTEKLVGNVKGCVGFIQTADFYVPNTVLNLDIRDYVTDCARIIAVFRKNIQEDKYTEITYKAKKLNISDYFLAQPYDYLKSLI